MQTAKSIINSDFLNFVGGKVDDERFSSLKLDSISSISDATHGSVTFFNGAFTYLKDLENTKAGACLVKEKHRDKIPSQTVAVVVSDPYYAMAKIVLEYIGTGEKYPISYRDFASESQGLISQNAAISTSAKIGKNVRIMPFAYIGENVEIGDNCIIHSHVSLEHCVIGDESVIRSGAKVGSCGFGFIPNFINGQHLPIPQISKVIIGKGVDIGANTTIDRGFLNNTTVGDYTKIDNLVHIGHGTRIGVSCFIAGCAVLAGSVEIGDFCMIGGQSAIAGGVSIPNRTQLMGFSAVASSIEGEGKTLAGAPACEATLWKRLHISAMKNVQMSMKSHDK